MNYNMNLGNWGSVFAVPSAVVDKYLLLASGPAVKVLLYLLKNNGSPVSEKAIAAALKITEETVTDALAFWVEAGLISNNNGLLSPSEEPLEEKAVSFVAKVEESEVVSVKKVTRESQKGLLSPSEIAERIEGSGEIKYLFNEAQKLFGKPLNYTEQRGLLNITDYIGLDPDIILMIIMYCKSVDKCTIRSIEAMSASWADEGINNHNDAAAKIASLKKRNRLAVKVKNIFGIERNLSAKENGYVEKWSLQYKMSLDMITKAYEIMCNNGVSKPSLAYVDKILSSWYADGITTPGKIPEDKKKSNSQSSKSAPSYDISEFEKKALANTPKGSKK